LLTIGGIDAQGIGCGLMGIFRRRAVRMCR
jgi:hypothetical protein